MLLIFQILFSVFALFAVTNVVGKKKDGLLGPKGAVFWILFWLIAALAVWWPNSTTLLANTFGIGRGTDFILYISIAVLFYLVFKLHIKLENVGRDVTKIVRREALDK